MSFFKKKSQSFAGFHSFHYILLRRRYFRSKNLKLIWNFTRLFVSLHRETKLKER